MNEIKPVYQLRDNDSEWASVCEDEFEWQKIHYPNDCRIVYSAAAYEALQKENAFVINDLHIARSHIGTLKAENAAQAKRITDITEKSELKAHKMRIEIESLRKQVEDLTDILVCVTHHDGALQEYKPRWISIVQDELSRRRSLSASKNGE